MASRFPFIPSMFHQPPFFTDWFHHLIYSIKLHMTLSLLFLSSPSSPYLNRTHHTPTHRRPLDSQERRCTPVICSHRCGCHRRSCLGKEVSQQTLEHRNNYYQSSLEWKTCFITFLYCNVAWCEWPARKSITYTTYVWFLVKNKRATDPCKNGP